MFRQIDIWTDIAIMPLKKIAKQLLFISRMPKLCAILQLVSAPLKFLSLIQIQLKIIEAIFINLMKPSLNQQVKHANLKLSL